MSYPVVFVVGPTATGKSRLGLELAQYFNGGILNCDSLQVYQRLDIGTAKPTPAERARVPHFFFDELKTGEILTAGDFRKRALEICERVLPNHALFAVGGSGFYIQAFEKGMFEVDKPDPEKERQVREEMEKNGPEFIFQELQRLDPEYAEEINPHDTYRALRALIVVLDSGRKMSELRREFKPQKFPYPYIKLGLTLSREELLPRVRARTREMLHAGLLAEVEALLAEGFENWPPMNSVGYKECVDVLRGRLAKERLEEQIVEKTLQLAKKQRTWFKRDADIQWLDPVDPLAQAIDLLTRQFQKLKS